MNTAGLTATSTVSAPIVEATTPDAPTVTAVASADGHATITFTPPSSNGYSAITGYTVTANPGGITATGTSSPLTVTGLTDGVSYAFTVAATNSIGTGPASLVSSSVTPTGIPTAPGIAGLAAADGQATITVAPPASSGGLPITYTVTASPGGITATGTGPTITVTGLTLGQSYRFTVTATNADGTSAPSAASGLVTEGTVPGAPTITGVTPGNDQATITFAAPSNDGGLPITSYTVTSFPGGIVATGSTSPITVTGLTYGVNYTFTVTASNFAGTSPSSITSLAVSPVAAVPAAPVITAVVAGPSSATIWVDPTVSNGGAPITSWTVTSSPATTAISSNSNMIVFTGLTPGQSYTFTVTATNAIGTSSASSSSNPVTALVSAAVIVQYFSSYGLLIDAITGDLIQYDGSEVDPVSYNTVIPAPANPPVQAFFYGYLLTLDPNSGLYTSFFGTTVDPVSGTEYDPYGDALDTIDLTQAYYVTTAGAVVAVLNPGVQLDPLTLSPLNSDPYTVEPTPVEYQSYYTYPEVGW